MNGQRSGMAGADSAQPRAPSLGDLLVIVGAIVLLVSLFLNWWKDPTGEVSVSAWTALEVADLMLAALAIIALVLAFPAPPGSAEFNRAAGAWRPWLGPIAVVVVAASLIHDPPSVNGLSPAVGAWIGLGGAVVLTAGGVLDRVGVSVTVASRS